MRITLILILQLTIAHALLGQTQFVYAGQTMTLVNYWNLPGTYHFEPVLPGDSEAVLAFKQYFNPASFETFKAMTLPEDWSGMTPDRFADWQENLKKSPLELTMAFHLRNNRGFEFLVLQYTVHQSHYRLSSTKAMKRVHGRWMHRNLDTGAETQMLERLGMVNKEFLLQQMSQQVPTVSLGAEVESQVRVHEEKFNRKDLEGEVRLALTKFGFSETDISYALTLFYDTDRNAMITYLLASKSVDRYALLKEINTQVGFEYYKYFQHQSKLQQ